MRVSHSPTRPRESRLSERNCACCGEDRYCGRPSTMLTTGGSMSRGGMPASAAPAPLPTRPRRSSDGTGEPARNASDSDRRPGVPAAVLASPNSESMSSSLTPQVSGYTKYTTEKRVNSASSWAQIRRVSFPRARWAQKQKKGAVREQNVPTTKLITQKNAWTR